MCAGTGLNERASTSVGADGLAGRGGGGAVGPPRGGEECAGTGLGAKGTGVGGVGEVCEVVPDRGGVQVLVGVDETGIVGVLSTLMGDDVGGEGL